jgi:hypothetical protein
MTDWDMNGDTTRSGYEAVIAGLKAELDQAAGVIADRNREIADLICDLDTAKSNTGAACTQLAAMREAMKKMLALFWNPRPDEYVDGGASYKLAMETVLFAYAALQTGEAVVQTEDQTP